MLSNWETYVSWFQTDPVNCVISVIITLIVILTSLILHECAHGYMALRCGDPTAKFMGRLSLNPLRHLDPIGTLCMLFCGFGWAKPVQVNPRNFENYRRDDFMVSIAGIVTNLTLFIACSMLAVVLNMAIWKADFLPVLNAIYGGADGAEALVNVFEAEGSPMAIYVAYGTSFDWFAGFTHVPWLLYIQRFLLLMADVNLTLAIFNLLPIPPLDGFHVLNDTILGGRLQLNSQAFHVAQLVLIIFLFSTDIVDGILIKGGELIGGSVIRVFLMLTGQM